MRGPVVHLQDARAAADVDAEGPPGEGLAEDALADVAGEEEAGASGGERGEEAELGDAQVLGLVDDGGVEGRRRRPDSLREARPDGAPGGQASGLEVGAGGGHDRPEGLALGAADAGLAAEAGDGGVGLAVADVPGVDDVGPLVEQELVGEGGGSGGLGGGEGGGDLGVGGDRDRADAGLVELAGEVGHRADGDAVGHVRALAEEAAELDAEGGGEGVGEGGEEDARGRVAAGEVGGAVEGDDGLAGAGGAGDAGGAGEGALDEVALGGVEEDGPGLPGGVEGGLELGARSPSGGSGAGRRGGRRGRACGSARGKGAGGGEGEERLGGFGGEVVHEGEEAVLVGGADVRQPVGRDAAGEEGGVVPGVEEAGGGGRRRGRGTRFLDELADLDDLGGAGGRVGLDAAAGGPGVGVVVVADVGEEEVRAALVDDDAEVVVDPDGPEVGVAGGVDAVELQARRGGVELEVDGGHLDRLANRPGLPFLRRRRRTNLHLREVHFVLRRL